MSKERKFHKLIEELDSEEKERVWAEIKKKDDARMQSEAETPTFPSRKVFSWRKVFAVGAVTVAVVLGSVFLIENLLPKKLITSLNSNESVREEDSGNSGLENGGRYCDVNMYTTLKIESTLRELDESLLYLDWYDRASFCETKVYQLNDAKEEIGYKEKISDATTGSSVTIRIIKKGYQLEELNGYQNTDKTEIINEIQIVWRNNRDGSYAKFTYGEYNYCVVLEFPSEEDSILDVVREMLD